MAKLVAVLSMLYELQKLDFVVAIRNHAVWLPA